MNEDYWVYPRQVTYSDGRQEIIWIKYEWNHTEHRLESHFESHGCASPGSPNYRGGFAYCDEAMRLFRRQPPRKQIILAVGEAI